MGFPTFTFETDDEQFVPGSVEALNERLDEELDVMRYLISNVWYWRARLDVQSIQVSDDEKSFSMWIQSWTGIDEQCNFAVC